MKKANTLLTILAGATLLLSSCAPQRMYLKGNVQGIPSKLNSKTYSELLEGFEINIGIEDAQFKLDNDGTSVGYYPGTIVGVNYYNKHFKIGTSYTIPKEKVITQQNHYLKGQDENGKNIKQEINLEGNLVSYPAIHISYIIASGKNTNMGFGIGFRPLFMDKTGTIKQYVTEDTYPDGNWEPIEHQIKNENINQRDNRSVTYFRLSGNLGYIGVWSEFGVGINPETGLSMRVGGSINIPLKHKTKLSR